MRGGGIVFLQIGMREMEGGDCITGMREIGGEGGGGRGGILLLQIGMREIGGGGGDCISTNREKLHVVSHPEINDTVV